MVTVSAALDASHVLLCCCVCNLDTTLLLLVGVVLVLWLVTLLYTQEQHQLMIISHSRETYCSYSTLMSTQKHASQLQGWCKLHLYVTLLLDGNTMFRTSPWLWCQHTATYCRQYTDFTQYWSDWFLQYSVFSSAA
jgi:hypothetical protein